MINRDLKSHLEYLDLIKDNKTGWHSTTYGINGQSLLSNLKHFDITICLPFDIMHSIFEGIALLHLNHLFIHPIDDLQCLSLAQPNYHIKSHQYGYSEVDTKPSLIDRESSKSPFHIKQSGTYIHYKCMFNSLTIIVILRFLVFRFSVYFKYCLRYIRNYCIDILIMIIIINSFTDDSFNVAATLHDWRQCPT